LSFDDIWKLLTTPKSDLTQLTLPSVWGRVDLRKLVAPRSDSVHLMDVAGYKIDQLTPLVVEGVQWRGLDFTGSQLDTMRFHDCEFTDCIFDKARCREWALWRCSFSSCSFVATDLRGGVFGGVQEGVRNRFTDVNFSRATLSGVIFGSAEFKNCRFGRLKKVDFEGSSFVDCSFEGILEEVEFRRFAGDLPDVPPNAMRNIDFTKARFRFVDFHDLDLENVRFPTDEEHIVFLEDYAKTLDRVVKELRKQADPRFKGVIAILANTRSQIRSDQQKGVVSKFDLREAGGGDAAVEEFLRIQKSTRS
jgi:fluoroquinolone resistance protein